jgi:hypothetical protein
MGKAMKIFGMFAMFAALLMVGCGQHSYDQGSGANEPAGAGKANQTDGALKNGSGSRDRAAGAGAGATGQEPQTNGSPGTLRQP